MNAGGTFDARRRPERWAGGEAVFIVRAITDADTLRRCVDLQVRIWGVDTAVVPDHQLIAASAAGGLVLGGFAADGTLAGFAYAFPGWRGARPLWYSHMTGVIPEHQGSGLGFMLKCGQRDAALAAGIDHIVWTYDPLQAGNARFNLGRLAAIASRYYADYYGAMTDAINRGSPSDRFEVDWFLRDRRVVAALSRSAPHLPAGRDAEWSLEAAERDPDRGPTPPRLGSSAARLLVEIPPDLNRLKADHPAAAAAWREATRAVLTHYMARGYAATNAAWVPDSPVPRVAYVLEQIEHGPAAPAGVRKEPTP